MGNTICPLTEYPSDIIGRLCTNREALNRLMCLAESGSVNLSEALSNARAAFEATNSSQKISELEQFKTVLEEYYSLCEMILNISALQDREAENLIVDTGVIFLPTGGGFGDLRDA